ncbi:hypothetical protein [Streptomyces beigongshangae]|uniref:hypothetical protein n=1 Tax=Streptomyces beigongshangae TaxID=2841597 RepID=UPI001C858313|nr:hypothetical protein [Streptomyces sp. REN17]
MLENFAGYRARTGAYRTVPIDGLLEEVDRLADQYDDGLPGSPAWGMDTWTAWAMARLARHPDEHGYAMGHLDDERRSSD